MTGLNCIPKAVFSIVMHKTELTLQPRIPVVTRGADICSCYVLNCGHVISWKTGKHRYRLDIDSNLRCTANGWADAVSRASWHGRCPGAVLTIFPLPLQS